MKALIPKWIFASVAKHFSVTGLPYYVESQKRDTNSYKDWIEFVFDGPDFNEVSKDFYHLTMTVSVLVNSTENNTDAYRFVKNAGLVASFFNKNISIYKYGETVLDTGEYFGCIKLISPVYINHFGRIATNAPVHKSSVVANYFMETKI